VQITDEGVPVAELVGVIKESVRQAGVSATSGNRDLQVASVQLTLQVVAGKAGGGKFSFRVPFTGMELSGGAKVTRRDTHTIDITLAPPAADRRAVRGDVEQTLVDAIETIRATVTAAALGNDPWDLSTATVDISFVITKSGSISLGFEGELSHDVSQRLRLSLRPAGG
jgi:hypothetical protein